VAFSRFACHRDGIFTETSKSLACKTFAVLRNPKRVIIFESFMLCYFRIGQEALDYGLMMGNKLKSDNPKGNLLRNISAAARYDVANEKHTFIELLDEKKPELRPHHPSRSSA
jgi:hypothetical protein